MNISELMKKFGSKSLNILEFRQFKGDHKIVGSDFEWMAKLRSQYETISPKDTKEPRFYYEDLEKFKKKKNLMDDILSHSINLAPCEQLLKTSASNHSNVAFSFNLRNNRNNGWNYSPMPLAHKEFEKILPPITKSSKDNVEKLKNLIVHPKDKKFEVN